MLPDAEDRAAGAATRDKVVELVEWLYAAAVVGAVALSPLWLTLLMGAVAPAVPAWPLATGALLLGVVAPAAIRSPHTHGMTAYERYGHNLGRALRAPIDLLRRRRQKRLTASASGPSSPVAVRLLEKGRR